jgi:protein-tyrosine phosphatase
MIDIHCHILPGMDDGSAEFEATMKMLRIAEDDGISHIMATPHYRCQKDEARNIFLENPTAVVENRELS